MWRVAREGVIAVTSTSVASFANKQGGNLQGPYAPQGSTALLPKLSVTSKVSARTSCAWVGSRVRFRSSEDVTLLEFTSPVDREYMRRCQKVLLNLKPGKYRLPTVGFTSEVSDYLVVHTGPDRCICVLDVHFQSLPWCLFVCLLPLT